MICLYFFSMKLCHLVTAFDDLDFILTFEQGKRKKRKKEKTQDCMGMWSYLIIFKVLT